MKNNNDNRIVVIGYGNALRGDDALGHLVVEHVAREWPQVVTIAVTQLVPELATLIASARAVIFVDACLDERGDVEIRELTAACPLSRRFHSTGPRELLALARSCYNRSPRAWMVIVHGRDFGYTDRLSNVAERNSERAVREIERLIEQLSVEDLHHA